MAERSMSLDRPAEQLNESILIRRVRNGEHEEHAEWAESFRQRLRGKEQRLLFTCFRRPNVPPTNNQAERSLRPVVLMRRVIQGTRSAKGLENHSVLRSLFETARRQGKKAHNFFLDLFTKSTVDAQAALYRKPLAKPSNAPGSRKPP